VVRCPATDRESGPAPNRSLQFWLSQRMLSPAAIAAPGREIMGSYDCTGTDAGIEPGVVSSSETRGGRMNDKDKEAWRVELERRGLERPFIAAAMT
jgi:hypothetical protein